MLIDPNRTLIFLKSFLPQLGIFLKKEFLETNSNTFNEQDLINALTTISKDEDFMPLLQVTLFLNIYHINSDQFVRFTRPSKFERQDRQENSPVSLPKLAEDFLSRYGDSPKFNYLAFVHYMVSSTKGAFFDKINTSLFAEKLLNVYWGSSGTRSERQRVSSQLYDILFIKLQSLHMLVLILL